MKTLAIELLIFGGVVWFASVYVKFWAAPRARTQAERARLHRVGSHIAYAAAAVFFVLGVVSVINL